jgi:hypothetical protein|tara:strand:+ start:727 stop:1152 length:426 start_codon:yes stop_codon:yes gene_type:complete
MNYQGVRAKFEEPIKTAYAALSPAVPVFFDNFGDVVSDAESEFVYVNIQFGITTQASLTNQFDQIQGIVTVRAFAEKDKGPARSQTLINTAFTSLQTINNTGQPTSGIYVRTGEITGPAFEDDRPFFISRIETNFQATVIS